MLWLRRHAARDQTLLAIGLSLVLGGALGNVIDRVMHGYVIDFIHFTLAQLGFPGVQHRRHRDLDRRRLLLLDAFLERGHGKERLQRAARGTE